MKIEKAIGREGSDPEQHKKAAISIKSFGYDLFIDNTASQSCT